MMSSSRCEDHVDLGGFLQTYVLGNPFQSQSVICTDSPRANPAPRRQTAAGKRKPPAKKKGTYRIVQRAPSAATQCENEARRTPPPQQHLSPLLALPHSPGQHASPTAAANTPGTVTSSLAKSQAIKPTDGDSSDDSCTKETYKELQQWLEEEFQCVSEAQPALPVLFSDAHFLSAARARWPQISRALARRLLCTSFPTVRQSSEKGDWINLIRKPGVCSCAHVGAALALQESSRHHHHTTLSSDADSEQCEAAEWELTLAAFRLQPEQDGPLVCSLLYWMDHESGRRLDLVALDALCREAGFQGHIDPLRGCMVGADDSEVTAKRKRSSVLGRLSQEDLDIHDDCAYDSDYSPPQTETSASHPAGRKRKKSRPIKHTTASARSNPPSMYSSRKVIGQLVAASPVIIDTTDSCTSVKNGCSSQVRYADVSDSSSDSDCVVSSVLARRASKGQRFEEHHLDRIVVKIKDEPLDTDADTSPPVNGDHVDRIDKHCDENDNCASSQQSKKAADHVSTQRAIKERVTSLERQLASAQTQLKASQKELTCARDQVSVLQLQAANKDNLLFELVKEFSDLNESFKRFGQKFQSALMGSMEG